MQKYYLIGRLNNEIVFKFDLLSYPYSDKIIWKGSSSGLYSTSSFCKSLISYPLPQSKVWKAVWCGLALPKMEFFCWLVINGKALFKVELIKRNILHASSNICPFCGKAPESSIHLFFSLFDFLESLNGML